MDENKIEIIHAILEELADSADFGGGAKTEEERLKMEGRKEAFDIARALFFEDEEIFYYYAKKMLVDKPNEEEGE